MNRGRTFATNGPLLGFTLGDAELGETLKFAAAAPSVPYVARLASIVAVEHLDLVCNGRVLATFVHGKPLDHGEFRGSIPLRESGWCLLRASSDAARYPVLDDDVYATTSPIYVDLGGRRPAAEKAGVLERLQRAKAVFTALE